MGRRIGARWIRAIALGRLGLSAADGLGAPAQVHTVGRLEPLSVGSGHPYARAATAIARSTELWFDYRRSGCGAGGSGFDASVMGDSVLATDFGLDFTLFTTVGDSGSIALPHRSAATIRALPARENEPPIVR